MSENKFTPGPWHVVLSDNATPFIQHEGGQDWSDIDDRSSRICHLPAEVMEDFNSLNNAHLIASAPDLLLALEDLLRDACEPMDSATTDYFRNQARAAIDKARGE